MPPVKHYSCSEVNQHELSSRLLSLTENNTSYTLTQINGQRIYRKAPHAWSGPEPSRNCEVFIGRIPHDCFEDTLVPLFRQAGELFEFRLMINFSGWNRGYAFAMYTNDAEASNAIRMFNNYMIRPSWQLGVCPSINNCRIFISRIPPTLSSAEIVRLLYELTDEVQEVRVRRSIASSAAIVEYKSHRGAAMARKALVAAAAAAWGCGARPAVDWSLPQSPQLLKQYRERGVELCRVAEEGAAAPPLAPSYTLEPWNGRGMESLMSSMASLSLLGGALGAGERAVWAPPGPPAARPPPANDFNPWTARHPLQEFITPHNEQVNAAEHPALRFSFNVAARRRRRCSGSVEMRAQTKTCARDARPPASASRPSVSYVIITFGLLVARIFQEIPRGKRILEGVLLGFGMLFFLILGGLELASLDSVPHNLVVNASVLGSLSLVVAALFLLDLMGPRTYTAVRHAQTDPVSSPKVDKKVTIFTQQTTNGILNGKQNGNVPPERPKDLDLGKTKTEKENITKTDGSSLFDSPSHGYTKFDDNIETELEKSKFGSLRNGIEGGNYVRLSDPISPMSEHDKLHYEQELAKFNERYFRDYLDNFAGKLVAKEDYLPELQTPKFAKVRSGRLKSLYDEVSPSYEQARKSPTRAKTVPAPTLQQLEDYLRTSPANRSRRADTPALFPMEPIEERDREGTDVDGRASGTPTDPGYVQYTAGKWPDKREIRTPRHSPK
ncbi:hypothetical protein MSG28_004305 [Choristoneura fumiferana]|uniref:Uncharacterized protein n=1 Tax=Choristoneura fumiferana TaxID=7141 RepID=A0ACC0KIC5_CHOFU|nr:hypothetical protein MSG28_004305 [Choristoneura fumiferana]